jgi:hypothetical protein
MTDAPVVIALTLFLFLPAIILLVAVVVGVRDADKKSDRNEGRTQGFLGADLFWRGSRRNRKVDPEQ